MITCIEDLIETAQEIGLGMSSNLVPHMKKAIFWTKEKRQEMINLAKEKSKGYKEHSESYITESKSRYLTLTNVSYISGNGITRNFVNQEIDDIVLAGLADFYLFNRFISLYFDPKIHLGWAN